MPRPGDDITNDFIKPTREYRKFVYELDKGQRAGLHNWLNYVVAVAEDALDIIDKADKK